MMTLRITKDDYKLLIMLYSESLNSIILKKAYNLPIPDEYNYNKYLELQYKLYSQGEEQKLITDDTIMPDSKLENLADKIENEKISKKQVGSILINEISQNSYIMEHLMNMAQQLEKNNISNIDVDKKPKL